MICFLYKSFNKSERLQLNPQNKLLGKNHENQNTCFNAECLHESGASSNKLDGFLVFYYTER